MKTLTLKREILRTETWNLRRYSTYAAIAGVDPTDHLAAGAGLPPIDSINQWPLISGVNGTSKSCHLPPATCQCAVQCVCVCVLLCCVCKCTPAAGTRVLTVGSYHSSSSLFRYGPSSGNRGGGYVGDYSERGRENTRGGNHYGGPQVIGRARRCAAPDQPVRVIPW